MALWLLQIDQGTLQNDADTGCHLEVTTYGDLGSLKWVENAPAPQIAGLLQYDVAYGMCFFSYAMSTLSESNLACLAQAPSISGMSCLHMASFHATSWRTARAATTSALNSPGRWAADVTSYYDLSG